MFVRNNNSYWLTTGMFPQELTIQFQQAQVVNEVRFVSTGVKKVAIEGCQTANGNGFKVIGESREIPANRGQRQSESVAIDQPSSYIMIKFVITEGWEDFASVHNIQVVWYASMQHEAPEHHQTNYI